MTLSLSYYCHRFSARRMSGSRKWKVDGNLGMVKSWCHGITWNVEETQWICAVWKLNVRVMEFFRWVYWMVRKGNVCWGAGISLNVEEMLVEELESLWMLRKCLLKSWNLFECWGNVSWGARILWNVEEMNCHGMDMMKHVGNGISCNV